jgi:hypothetical protein
MEMTVKELIEVLEQQPSHANVTVWVDGERLPTFDVDTSFVDEYCFVEINVEVLK